MLRKAEDPAAQNGIQAVTLKPTPMGNVSEPTRGALLNPLSNYCCGQNGLFLAKYNCALNNY